MIVGGALLFVGQVVAPSFRSLTTILPSETVGVVLG